MYTAACAGQSCAKARWLCPYIGDHFHYTGHFSSYVAAESLRDAWLPMQAQLPLAGVTL